MHMKRIWTLMILMLFLVGCAKEDGQLDRAMNVRAKWIAKTVCFDANVVADYGDETYEFTMECNAAPEGELRFTVKAPQTIAGIKGTVSATGGKLTFDDTALAFDLMADGQINPVSAPWVLVRTLRSGYLTSCCEEDGLLRVSIDDSYEEDALHMEIWLDGADQLREAEIYWRGRRLMWISVSNFRME